jgi:hypothetical protein
MCVLCIGTLASTFTLILPVISHTIHLLPKHIGHSISAGNGAGKVTVNAFFI